MFGDRRRSPREQPEGRLDLGAQRLIWKGRDGPRRAKEQRLEVQDMAELPGSLAEKVAALEKQMLGMDADLKSWELMHETMQDLMEQVLEITSRLEKRIARTEKILELQLQAKRAARENAAKGGGS